MIIIVTYYCTVIGFASRISNPGLELTERSTDSNITEAWKRTFI